MRLIDADALIDDIKNHLWDWETVNGITAQTVLKQTITDVENQPTASPWHRVEEELPEIGKRVLVYYGGDVQILKRTDSMTYDGKNYWWNEADVLWERVEEGSYWMPIEPPKGDKDAD